LVESIDELTPEWAWGGATGRGVRVAVVDSGIDATHPDLDGCVDVAGGARVELDDERTPQIVVGPHDDSFGHGTACAGIIHRLAPEATITSVKVLGASLGGTSEVFLAGLSWAVEQGFDVINLSLGSRKRDWALAFHDICDEAYFKGLFLTTAANNIERVTYPSLFASVASVASNVSSDPFRFHHNPDPPTEFLARGIDVTVPWLEHGHLVTTGNSFAAPHIAGIAALIRSKHPELRPFQLKTVLWATSANVQEASQRAGRLSRMVRQSDLRATRATRSIRAADVIANPG
jgi:subtilisin family serine protease